MPFPSVIATLSSKWTNASTLHMRQKNFSKLDGNTGYWQIEIDENMNYKESSLTRHCYSREKRVPFRLKNGAKFRPTVLIIATVECQYALLHFKDVAEFHRPPHRFLKKLIFLKVDKELRALSKTKEKIFLQTLAGILGI